MKFILTINTGFNDTNFDNPSVKQVEDVLDLICVQGYFMILDAEQPIANCSSVQCALVDDAVYLFEAIFREENVLKIYGFKTKNVDTVRRQFVSYMSGSAPDVKDWEIIRDDKRKYGGQIAFYFEAELVSLIMKNGITPLPCSCKTKTNVLILENCGPETLIEYAQKNNIHNIFYTYFYSNINNYLIDEDAAKQSFGDVYNAISKDIIAHNDIVRASNFEQPAAMTLFCLHQGAIVQTSQIAAGWIEGLAAGEDVLKELRSKNEIQMLLIEKQKEAEAQGLKEELIKTILADPDFELRTNQNLRKEYIFSLLSKSENERFRKIFLYRKTLGAGSGQGYEYNILTFIDYVSAIKRNKKYTGIVDWNN